MSINKAKHTGETIIFEGQEFPVMFKITRKDKPPELEVYIKEIGFFTSNTLEGLKEEIVKWKPSASIGVWTGSLYSSPYTGTIRNDTIFSEYGGVAPSYSVTFPLSRLEEVSERRKQEYDECQRRYEQDKAEREARIKEWILTLKEKI